MKLFITATLLFMFLSVYSQIPDSSTWSVGDDITDKLSWNNLSFSDDPMDAWTFTSSAGITTQTGGLFELYDGADADLYQYVQLPAGMYKLECRAYYRCGNSWADDPSLFNTENWEDNALLYIQDGEYDISSREFTPNQTYETPLMPRLFPMQQEQIYQMPDNDEAGWDMSDGYYDGLDCWGPCSVPGTLAWFAVGMYGAYDDGNGTTYNTVSFTLKFSGYVRVGIKKESAQTADAFLCTEFKMYYMGEMGEDETSSNIVYASDFDNEMTGGVPTGWVTYNEAGFHTYGFNDESRNSQYNYNWGGIPGGGGSRLFGGFGGDFQKALYWGTRSTNEGYAEYGSLVKDWIREDGSLDPDMPEGIALELEPRNYQLSFLMAAWKDEPTFICTIEDLEGNVYAKFVDILAEPNLNGAYENVTGSVEYVDNFSIDKAGFYVIRFTSNEAEWQEFLLAKVKITTDSSDQSSEIINFADAEVKRICVENWDTDGDGELSYNEAAAVKDLGEVFRENKSITSFNELQYFITLTSIGEHAFYSCNYLTSINIPEGVTSIRDEAFCICNRLTSINIPVSVTSIGNNVFSGCNSLTSVNIPEGVTSIGYYAFEYCSRLTSITCYIKEPFSISKNVFEGVSSNSILYVPQASKARYESTEGWKDFPGTIVEMPGDNYIITYMVDGEVFTTAECEEDATITPIAGPTKEGYTFSWTDVPATMPSEDITITGTFRLNDDYYDLQLPVSQGWNWFSSSLTAAEKQNPRTLLEPFADNVVILQSQTQQLVNDPQQGLLGDLTEIVPGVGYKLQLSETNELPMTGSAMLPTAATVSLVKGWNWIGYVPNTAMPIATALAGLQASEGDVVKNQTAFAVYENGQWTGTLVTMSPGDGYLYHADAATSFKYPTPSLAKPRQYVQQLTTLVESPWSVDTHAYPDNMSVIANLEGMDADDAQSRYIVAAFSGDECRGVGRFIDGRLFLTIHGTSSIREAIRFVLYDRDECSELQIHEQLLFGNRLEGSLAKPYTLHVDENSAIDIVYSGALPDNTEYYTLQGIRVSSPLKGQTYIVVARTHNGKVVRKVSKIK